MMDGQLLSFLEPIDLYSLMSNALSNAMRTLEKADGKDRILSITLKQEKGIRTLEIDNFYKGEVRFDDQGLPLSDKDDGKNHGYGSKSISYIVKKYSGTVSYRTDHNIFRLIVSF